MAASSLFGAVGERYMRLASPERYEMSTQMSCLFCQLSPRAVPDDPVGRPPVRPTCPSGATATRIGRSLAHRRFGFAAVDPFGRRCLSLAAAMWALGAAGLDASPATPAAWQTGRLSIALLSFSPPHPHPAPSSPPPSRPGRALHPKYSVCVTLRCQANAARDGGGQRRRRAG